MRTIVEVLVALIIFENLKILWRALQHLWRHRSADRETDDYIQRLQRKLEDHQVLADCHRNERHEDLDNQAENTAAHSGLER